MMDRKNKVWTFLKTKGFYLALALAIAGAGTAAWLTAQNAARAIREAAENTPDPPPAEAQEEADRWDYDDILEQQTELEADAAPEQPEPKPALTAQPEPVSPPVSPAGAKPASREPIFCLPVADTRVLTPMSGRTPVKNYTLGVWRTHDGADLAAAKGAPVSAAAAGTVTGVGSDPLWGGVITLKHADGWCSVYRGVLPEKALRANDRVEAGQILGTVTEIPCESAMEPHLHFTLSKDGVLQDPVPLLPLGLQETE